MAALNPLLRRGSRRGRGRRDTRRDRRDTRRDRRDARRDRRDARRFPNADSLFEIR